MNQLVERKHIVAYLKNYPFCSYIFLEQLRVFFVPIDLSYYSVHENIKIRL